MLNLGEDMLKLLMMRGVPGCGKSTKAEQLLIKEASLGRNAHIFSTDAFWGVEYNFVQAKLREAHLWNQNRAMAKMIEVYALKEHNTTIIIDNTNICSWELRPYVKPALQLNFAIEIIEPSTSWAFDAEECARRTVHGVPVETIRSMLARWEKDLTVEQCLAAVAPWEKTA